MGRSSSRIAGRLKSTERFEPLTNAFLCDGKVARNAESRIATDERGTIVQIPTITPDKLPPVERETIEGKDASLGLYGRLLKKEGLPKDWDNRLLDIPSRQME